MSDLDIDRSYEYADEHHVTVDADRDTVHVVPAYGRNHEPTPRCWCRPDQDADEPLVWIHKEQN